MPTKDKLDDELIASLKDIVKSCEHEDKDIRKAMVRQWKKAEEFWHGVQFLFWSSRDNGWKSPVDMGYEDDEELDEELGSFSDKVIDIYKAHGESIISALSAQIPSLRFLPDDADSPEDTLTARTYNKVADVVQRHNKAKLVFLRALFFLANQGIVASYRYKDSDPSYGTYKVPVYGEKEVESISYTCADCGSDAAASETPCPQCGSVEPPKETKTKNKVPELQTVEDRPKTRVKLDIFGALHFKVSYYARNQAECSYLGLFLDQGKDIACETYPDLCEEIQGDTIENLDRFARAAYVFPSEEEVEKKNLVAVSKWWLRPAAFYREPSKEKREKLLKKFPDGCRVIFIGKQKHFAEAIPEKLDDRWEIGQAGLSTYIYSDAILRPLIQIQEMRNQLVNLIMETIEHAIPAEFARPDVLNFAEYGKYEAVPGYTYKAMPGRPGDKLSDGFYTSTRSTLSKEVSAFLHQLDQDAQFAIGSFPSIYGGPSEGKSRTFAEYAASRQMALQRLSIVWQLVTDWWMRTISGSVLLYVDSLVEDEKYTKFESGSYVNVWIKKSQMLGKIGGVEPEASESFPTSLTQKKDLFMKLIEMNNDFINSALYAPENARTIQDVMALTELKLPGEAQRVKQVIEIHDMMKDGIIAVHTGVPGPNGQEIVQTSIPIDPDVDDHVVHMSTLQAFMVDLPGLDVAAEHPEQYENMRAHYKAHEQAQAMKTMQMNATQPGVAPETAHAGVEE